MTDPVANPSCPVCGGNERTERHAHGWLCVACWTVFEGSPGEWSRWREKRERRARMYGAAS